MQAIVSGQAGLAVLVDRNDVWSVEIDEPTIRIPRRQTDLPYLFNGATDLAFHEDVTKDSAVAILEGAWRSDRTLRLILILVDRNAHEEVRTLAAEALDDSFWTGDAAAFACSRLYAAPLPQGSDLPGAIRRAEEAKSSGLAELLRSLAHNQGAIVRCRRAWDQLDPQVLGGKDTKRKFESAAVATGAFRRIASAAGRKTDLDGALAWCLLEGSLLDFRGHRQILTEWLSPLLAAAATEDRRPLEEMAEDDIDDSGDPHGILAGSPRRGTSVHEAFTGAAERREEIIKLIKRRRFEAARRKITHLIEFQLPRGDASFLAQSLCDIAQRAKEMGEMDFQLELTRRAVELCPGDGWGQAQLGDALKNTGQYSDAMDAYGLAATLGKESIARNGRAEVLKAMGRFPEALVEYEGTIRDFPTDVVPRNGRAEVLKAMGRFPEALAKYEGTIRDFPTDVHARSGLAAVLKDMGRFPEALAEYERTIRDFPTAVVPRSGRAEVLKAMGRFPEALAQYEGTIRDFPTNVVSRSGRAEVLKAMGRFPEALAQYEGTIRDFPTDMVVLNGKATLLALLERYAEALALISKIGRGAADDWVAEHIRAMIALRRGQVDQAIEMLERGVSECPWFEHRKYFRTALAIARLRRGEFQEALSAIETEDDSVCQVLKLHALGALGRLPEAKSIDERLQQFPLRLAEPLRQELVGRFLVTPSSSNYTDDWVFEQECLLPLAA